MEINKPLYHEDNQQTFKLILKHPTKQQVYKQQQQKAKLKQEVKQKKE